MSLCFCAGRVVLGRAQLGRHSLEYHGINNYWGRPLHLRMSSVGSARMGPLYRHPQLSGRHLMWLGHPQPSDPSEWTDLYLHWSIYDGLGAGRFISRVK